MLGRGCVEPVEAVLLLLTLFKHDFRFRKSRVSFRHKSLVHLQNLKNSGA